MVSWSNQRKFFYTVIFFLVVFVVVGIPTFFLTYEWPTCTDSIQNQKEEGVDCGGPCSKLCPKQFIQPIVLWSRVTKVSDGVYNAVSYIENPNIDKSAPFTNYLFKLYDSENVLIKEVLGKISIPSGQIFSVFEGGIMTGNRIPVRSTFSFTEDPMWEKREKMTQNLNISNEEISGEDKSPKVSALLENLGVSEIKNIELVALLFDSKDNVVGASKTLVDSLSGGSSKTLVFTWRESFKEKIYKIEIIPNILSIR